MQLLIIASEILLILSIFNFVLAAPVAVREINEVRVNAVDVDKVGMTASEKRMDPEDQWSTNAGSLADESTRTISSDSTASSAPTPPEPDTATSRQPLSTGSHPGSSDNSPSDPGQADAAPTDDTLQSYSVSTGDLAPVHSASTGYSPPSHLVSTDYSPPSHSVLTTDNYSPPSTSQNPGSPKSEKVLGKLMKGKFERRISGHGPGNVARRELQGTFGPSACVSTPSLPLLPTFTPPE